MGGAINETNMDRRFTYIVVFLVLLFLPEQGNSFGQVFQASGFKIVNVDATTATIWTRVTQHSDANPSNGPLPIIDAIDRSTYKPVTLRENRSYSNVDVLVKMPSGLTLNEARGGAPAESGQTRVRYRIKGSSNWKDTSWQNTYLPHDGINIHKLTDLSPGSSYELLVEARSGSDDSDFCRQVGEFETTPLPGQHPPVTFTVMTCQQYEHQDRPDGFAIYAAMAELKPDFFVNTGDAVYYDHGPVIALNPALARYHWARIFALPSLRKFHSQVSSYFMKDDHDVLSNDCGPDDQSGELTYATGVNIFREQTGLPNISYRTFQWGRDLQIWLMEGRDYRTPNWKESSSSAPTLWGPEQIKWLQNTLAASTATFRVVITTVPIIGPDRDNKADNYANSAFIVEGTEIRRLLGQYANLTVITGDRHWQYVSVDPNSSLMEWSMGPASDAHAGGWDETTPRPEHRFLRTGHGGFLSAKIQPEESATSLILSLHDVDGRVVYREEKSAHLSLGLVGNN